LVFRTLVAEWAISLASINEIPRWSVSIGLSVISMLILRYDMVHGTKSVVAGDSRFISHGIPFFTLDPLDAPECDEFTEIYPSTNILVSEVKRR
jgi:hypothetical protein